MSWNFELVAGPFSSRIDSPTWDGQRVLFTQVEESKIWQYDPVSGETTEFRRYTSRTTRLALSSDGILYGAQSGSRRIVTFNPDGSTNQLADRIDGRYHNHPFDLDVDRHGRIWFSDPYSPIPTPGPQIFPTLDFCAILRQEPSNLKSRDWVIRRMTIDTINPGAILLSKDERDLYVMERDQRSSEESELRAYPLKEDGSLGRPKILQTFPCDPQDHSCSVAGMCLDSEGKIVACGTMNTGDEGSAVFVLSPDGVVQERYPVPGDQPTSCGFGDPDLQSLYITTENGKLYRVSNTDRQGLIRLT
ncbi:MAG: SMP-30/gluconolactonase/LRE family protein [Nitrospirota bacterium]|nr:MAG: SMP-30/gluconolactonase/LRE family protein [Nitrospirota bacterium]